ncbi:MAG: YhgE/Pip family protein [Lentilactobacillus diolivorans]
MNHGKSLSIATKQTLNSARNNLSNGLNSLHSQTDRLQTALSDLQSLNSNGEFPIATDELNQVQNLNNAMINQINNGLKVLDVINNLLPNNRSTTLIKLLASIKGDIHAQQKNIDQLKSLANSSKSSRLIRQLINRSSQIGNRIESTITNASAEFDATTNQNLDSMENTLNTGLANDNNVLSATKTLIPELKALANAGNSVSQLSVSRINSMNNRLNNIQDKLNGLNYKTGFINEKNLTRLVNALGESPQVSNLLSSPISLKTTNLYRLGKFGYGVTPFYTVLSMWIGVLLLTTIMAWKYRTNQGKRLTPNMVQGYCGKLLLYLCMTLGQTTVTLFGEIVLLGIHPGSFLSMIAFAYLITLVFTIVIYTLVFMFGNIGKVISVLLMILQIFGTGGIYPLETIPSQLAALAPFLPFTYAIQGLREAIAGPNWATFSHDILMLICLAITFIVIAPLRRIFKRPIDKLEKGMKNSRL